MSKKDRNITITLNFQDVLDPESGELFMSVGGTVVKRHVDDEGIEIYNEKGELEHTRVDFMMVAKEIQKDLPKIIRKLRDQALEQYEQENKDKKENEEEGE